MLAKDNFVLAHKNLIPGVLNLLQQQQDDEIMMGKSKEVEEWLMGSGESAETAASRGLKGNPQFKLVTGPQKAEEAPKQPPQSEKVEDEKEEWMFKTFSRQNKPKEEEIQQDSFGLDGFMMHKRMEPKMEEPDTSAPLLMEYDTPHNNSNDLSQAPSDPGISHNLQLDQFINQMDHMAFMSQINYPPQHTDLSGGFGSF